MQSQTDWSSSFSPAERISRGSIRTQTHERHARVPAALQTQETQRTDTQDHRQCSTESNKKIIVVSNSENTSLGRRNPSFQTLSYDSLVAADLDQKYLIISTQTGTPPMHPAANCLTPPPKTERERFFFFSFSLLSFASSQASATLRLLAYWGSRFSRTANILELMLAVKPSTCLLYCSTCLALSMPSSRLGSVGSLNSRCHSSSGSSGCLARVR